MPREVPVAVRQPPGDVEVARLEALRRVAMGAAHALNNAFTTLVGEASFLREDRKQDPLVAETCETMLAELDRCTRITRALLARRHPSQAGRREVDMVRLVRELGSLLAETLGSQSQLRLSHPDDLVLVEGEAGALEVLTLSLVHYAADAAGGPSRLHLAVTPVPHAGVVELRLAAESQRPAEEVAEPFVSPDLAADPTTRTQLHAVAQLVEAHGGWRMAEQTGPGSWVARVVLPTLS